MTTQEKLDRITNYLMNGGTVVISTHLRAIKITSKNYKKWLDRGDVMLKASGDSLYVAAGNRFDCIDGCKIEGM